MTFSIKVKDELNKYNFFLNKEIICAEINGYNLTTNVTIKNGQVFFITENNVERYKRLLENLNIKYIIEKKGKCYIIQYRNKNCFKEIDVDNKEILKAILRGAFLAAGSINNPNNKYHLEILVKTKENANFISYITEQFEINAKILKRKNKYSIYLKDGETISNFLALIGANKSVLNFEEIRVMRATKNNVNRMVNCETANLNKIVDTSFLQIEAIKYIIERNKFDELPDNLKEMAKIRMENPYLTLEQMGKLLSKPIGKSGVNHRLKKIILISLELKNEIEGNK